MKIYQKAILAAILLLPVNSILKAQDFMMQGWYWDYPKSTDGAKWADTLMLQAERIGNAGFTYLWAPPLSRASFGAGSNGYDPRDLYDYGSASVGATGVGLESDIDLAVSTLNSYGVNTVADVIYNHRDGGKPENNPGLKAYVAAYDWTAANNGDQPFPYDRMRCIIPLGGSSMNTAGHYYFKVSSASQHSNFHNWEYNIYFATNTVGWQGLADLSESEPNGGGDCSQGNNDVELGRNMNAWIDASGCTVDEFHLEILASDYDPAGDTLFIYFDKRGSGYSDMRIYGIWSGPGSMDIIGDMEYQTWTDFSSMPSGQGAMNWSNFKPNLSNSTGLSGDWDGMYFFYDYDQYQASTKTALIDWTKWHWNDVNIRGFRMDAVKHFTPEFVGDMLDALHDDAIIPGMVVGEWYGTNTAELAGWVNDVLSYMDADTKTDIHPRIFDFSLRENLRKACDDGSFDSRNVFQGSLVDVEGLSGFHVVTFLNNHDFRDNSGFASLVQNDPILGYVYLLTNNKLGIPTVFYPDYFGYPDDALTYPYHPTGIDPLKEEIDQLIGIHKKYIYNATGQEYLNRFSTPYSSSYISGSADKALIYQLSGGVGGKEVIVAINYGNTDLKVDHEIKLINGLAVGSQLSDICGNSEFPYAQVNASSQIYISLPARSWSVWVQGYPVEPLMPAPLSVVSAADNQIILEWTDQSANEDNFVLERKEGAGGSWSIIGSPAANATTYSDTWSLTDGVEYYYRIKAVNTAGDSDYSPEVHTPNHIKWRGHSADWSNKHNWTHHRNPDANTDVRIPQLPASKDYPTQCSGSSYGTIRDLFLEENSYMECVSGKTLTIEKTP